MNAATSLCRQLPSQIVGASLVISLLVLTPVAFGSTITVNSTADAVVADDGECTLREAIQAANSNTASGIAAGECAAGEASPAVDTVAFAIPGAGVHTIAPTSSLPPITEAVVIDGYTQPGNGGPDASPNTLAVGDDAVLLIEISGASAPGLTMISIQGPAGGSMVRGLVINQTNAGHAFAVGFSTTSSNNTITGNFIGLDPTGTTVPGSGAAPDVFIDGSSNTFGGTTPATRNVMVGSIVLDSGGGSVVQGNYFGTNASGTAALSGGAIGIKVLTNGNTIGGTASGAGNVIAGTSIAILISGAVPGGGNNNVIQGNRIGTNAAGTAALGNTYGISTDNGGGNNLIGGSVAAAGNLISGNGTGIFLQDSAHAYTIHGNLIGADVTGTLPVPNSGDGIRIFTLPAGTSIGGPAPGDGNIIAFNGGQGVGMINSAVLTGLAILGNSIFSNGGLGISLDDTSTPIENDAGDPDAGANNLQNFPVLDAPIFGGGTSTTGTLNSTPGHSFRIEVFANDACDPSLHGEGKTFVGTVDTGTTDVNGDVAFTVDFGRTLGATLLTATATDLMTNDTSEFSTCPVVPTTSTTSTTTITSTSSSTTSTTSTTSTSTSSMTATTSPSSSSTTSPSTSTSSTTQARATTTTTTLAGCLGVADGATFASIICRLEALLARVNAEQGLGTFQPKLAHTLTKARDRATEARDLCAASNAKKSKTRLKQVGHALTQYVHRLAGLPARKKLDDTLRRSFLDEGSAIEPDVGTLRKDLHCPADAGS